MTDLGKYLYCVIRCSEERIFEDIAPIGDASGPVHTVPCDGLAMVVSNTPIKDHETTRANVLAHERVQERVMEDFTLLPVRFGSVTNDFASAIPDIRKLLEKRSQDFDRLLADMEGKVELGLKALWRDEKAIFEEIVAENQGIRRLRDSLRRKPPTVARFEGIPLGGMVKEALERKKTEEAVAIMARLSGVASHVRGSDIIVDRMILNEAFLVDKGRQEELDIAVSKLDEDLNHRIVFKYTGPNPPWNFVEIVVNWEEL